MSYVPTWPTAHSLHQSQKTWGLDGSDAGSAAVRLIDHSNFDRRKIVGERPAPDHGLEVHDACRLPALRARDSFYQSKCDR